MFFLIRYFWTLFNLQVEGRLILDKARLSGVIKQTIAGEPEVFPSVIKYEESVIFRLRQKFLYI